MASEPVSGRNILLSAEIRQTDKSEENGSFKIGNSDNGLPGKSDTPAIIFRERMFETKRRFAPAACFCYESGLLNLK